MNNKRGYTVIELIVVMAFVSTIVFSAMYVPNGLIKMNQEYEGFSDSVKSSYSLRTSISKDILSEEVEILGENKLKVGGHTYTFSDTDVMRDNVRVSNDKFEFSFENDSLKIYNEDVNLEYYISTSMGGAKNE